MNYKRHLKQNHAAAIVFSILVVVTILVMAALIAERQRSMLAQLDTDIRNEGIDINLAKLLHERRVLRLTNDVPTIEDAFEALISETGFPAYLVRLDSYLQASRVFNSTFRNEPGTAVKIIAQQDLRDRVPTSETDEIAADDDGEQQPSLPSQNASRNVIPIPWYVMFFGYEQYLCFFLAALCLGELFAIRQRMNAEEKIARSTTKPLDINVPDDNEIDIHTTQSLLHDFNTKSGSLIFKSENLDNKKLQKMQRFAWVAMVNNLLSVFRRTGDRMQSLEAANSTLESAQARFDGNFHFEQYLQWAIPSIGFLGTIRGIAAAMGAAQVADDLPIVVSYLGVAFYSTLTALVLNLILMGVRATTLNRADVVFARLEEKMRRDVVARLATPVLSPTGAPPAAAPAG